MNEILNKFLLAGDKFMPEMDLKQPRLIVLAYHLQKNEEIIQKFKETGDTSYIYKEVLVKSCFQHGMPYKYFQDLGWRTATGKILRLRLILLKILNMMDIKEDLFLWFPLFLIKGLPAVVLICIQIIK